MTSGRGRAKARNFPAAGRASPAVPSALACVVGRPTHPPSVSSRRQRLYIWAPAAPAPPTSIRRRVTSHTRPRARCLWPFCTLGRLGETPPPRSRRVRPPSVPTASRVRAPTAISTHTERQPRLSLPPSPPASPSTMAFVTSAAAAIRPTAARAATSTAAVGRRDGAFVQPLRAAARIAAPRAAVSMKSNEQQSVEVRAICGACGAVDVRGDCRLGGVAHSWWAAHCCPCSGLRVARRGVWQSKCDLAARAC